MKIRDGYWTEKINILIIECCGKENEVRADRGKWQCPLCFKVFNLMKEKNDAN